MSSPSISTIVKFYKVVTSLTSFGNEAKRCQEDVVKAIPLLFESETEFRNHAKEIKNGIILGITD